MVGVEDTESVEQAVLRMRANDFSQIPITRQERIVGSLSETRAYAAIVEDPKIRTSRCARSCASPSAMWTSKRRCRCWPR